jgi:hypothetical protein
VCAGEFEAHSSENVDAFIHEKETRPDWDVGSDGPAERTRQEGNEMSIEDALARDLDAQTDRAIAAGLRSLR